MATHGLHRSNDHKMDTDNDARDGNTIALLEEEIRKLRQRDEQVQREKDYIVQQCQIEVKKANDKAQQSKHPHDFIGVDAKEQEVARQLTTTINNLVKEVAKLTSLQFTDVGIVEDTTLLPEKTSDGGLEEIDKNIKSKSAEQRKRWSRILKHMRRLRKDYTDIQKLRHRKIKYRRKHKSAAKKQEKIKAAKNTALVMKFADDEAEEDLRSESEIDRDTGMPDLR